MSMEEPDYEALGTALQPGRSSSRAAGWPPSVMMLRAAHALESQKAAKAGDRYRVPAAIVRSVGVVDADGG